MGWYRLDACSARAAFFDRRGGVSVEPFDSLNLSFDQDDDPSRVERNRKIAGAFAGASPETWVPVRQVHGTDVVVADSGEASTTVHVDADAVVVTEPGVAGLILTADCAPLALFGPGAVAAAHGGWRGLLDGVVAQAVGELERVTGSVTTAVLGPCIHPCCYEFGESDLATVTARFGDQVRSVTRNGAPALDLPGVVRAALVEAGFVGLREIEVCTACSADYFSHRRDGAGGGRTGRQGLLVRRLA